VNDEGVVSMKVTTIGAMEPVGGTGPNSHVQANKVVTAKGVMDQTISWQAADGDNVVRYREQSFSASTGELELEEYGSRTKLHIDGTAAHIGSRARAGCRSTRRRSCRWAARLTPTRRTIAGTSCPRARA
jgi:hypothetical protein